jgi:two-component system, chemotaxis family, protein-glutamate methylesterase/glutaminase
MLGGTLSPPRHSPPFDVVAIVGSQGALPVARALVRSLPADFPAAIVYVQHRIATSLGGLPALIARSTALPVGLVRDGDALIPGTIHVAPADAQTTVADGRFRLGPGRCVGDPVFVSLARAYGARTIGVVLSGRLDDGAAGLRAIKAAGGRALVQEPSTAERSGMPTAAMSTGCYDFVLPGDRLAHALVALAAVPGAAELLSVRGHPLVAATAA